MPSSALHAGNTRLRCPLTCLLLAGCALCTPLKAQAPATTQTNHPADLTWIRSLAVPYRVQESRPPAVISQGRENQLNGDPRFAKLLRTAFPQHQWFWRDHRAFTPVSSLVQTFIAVPGSALLDEDRYVTADGCVPHDCTDRGMLWIDTAQTTPTLIFLATGAVRDVKGSNAVHLWLFASKHLDFTNLPPAFLSSLQRWHDINTANNYPEDFILVTLVQPTGEQVDLTPPTLNYKANQPGARP